MHFYRKSAVVFLLLLIVVGLVQCGGPADNQSADGTVNTRPITKSISPEDDIVQGEKLAVQYCQSCHELPAPSLLNKYTWQRSVLPIMGLHLGLKYHLSDSIRIDQLGNMDYFPSKPALDSVQWQQIIAYYTAKAPRQLPVPDKTEPIHELPMFQVITAPAQFVSSKSLTSFVKIDKSVSPLRLIVVDGIRNKLIVLDNKVKLVNTTEMDGAVVDMVFQKDKIIATSMGKDLWSVNNAKGTVKEISIDKKGKVALQERTILNKLRRPVSTDVTDFNGDGKPDYLVSQFGKILGRLSWFEEINGALKEHVLRDKPGSIKTIIDTDNPSKVASIWAMFAQGEEAIFHYVNDGKGNFTEKKILNFPPSYGSSYFDLVDFNGDGFKDIIYTAGDNGDYSQIIKPYHGIYIYLNDGKDNFTQKYFYPINGCYKAIAKDFDGDGDLDIATISQFPGKNTPWEAFMYFENKGKFNFNTYTLPVNIPFSRATTMDAGDIDGDGKPDLLIGSGFADPDPDMLVTQPMFMVLKNKSR